MLDVFRRHAYSRGTRAILIFLGAVLALFIGGTSYFANARPVATVNCRTLLHLYTLPGCTQITSEDVDREAGNIRRAVLNNRGADAEQLLQGVNLREMAVESLIEQTVIANEAHRLGLKVSDDDLAQAIESQTAFQTDGHFDEARYEAVLRDNMLQPSTFESETRAKILADTLRTMVTGAVAVSNNELRTDFNQLGEKLSLAYIEFPFKNFIGARPTDQEIAAYYRDHQDDFRVPDMVKAEFIRYDPAVLAPKQPPSEEDITQFYEQNLKTMFTHPEQLHVRHILIALPPNPSPEQDAKAKQQAENLLAKVKSGASFSDLAKTYSDDPGAKTNGGDLGMVTRGELVPAFEEVAFKLKPGQAAIAKTQFGYHVIQVVGFQGAKVDSIEEARPRIISALQLKAGQDAARAMVDEDTAAADIGRSLDEIAKKRGLVKVATPFFAATDTVKGAEDNPNFAKDAFAMKTGDVRSLTDGQTPYLLKVVGREPAHLRSLAEVSDQIAGIIERTRAEAAANKAATALLKQINSPQSFDTVAQSHHLDVKTTGDFVRAEAEIPGIGSSPQLAQAAGAVTAVPGVLPQVVQNDGNSYIIKVLSRTPPSDSEWQAAQAQFTARVLQSRQEQAWSQFVNQLKQRALITVNPDMIGAPSTA